MPKTNPVPLQMYNTNLSRFYIRDMRTGEVFDIPFPPEEISERPNMPSFSGESVLGRTSQIVNYTLSENRTLSFSFKVIDDYTTLSLTEVRDILSSMAMPKYNYNFQIQPPQVEVKLGALMLRGVITDITFTWSGVFRNGTWNILNVNIGVKEAREIPVGAAEVRAGGWKNG